MLHKAIGMTPSILKPKNSSEVEDSTFKQSSQPSSDNSLQEASVLVSHRQWLRHVIPLVRVPVKTEK